MTLQEYYKEIGDYDDVITRLMNEKLISKFICKFADDTSFHDLKQAIADGNYADAFRHAHTLKGVSRNLALTKLFELSGEITETLRDEQAHDVSDKMEQLSAEYDKVINIIDQIKAKMQ